MWSTATWPVFSYFDRWWCSCKKHNWQPWVYDPCFEKKFFHVVHWHGLLVWCLEKVHYMYILTKKKWRESTLLISYLAIYQRFSAYSGVKNFGKQFITSTKLFLLVFTETVSLSKNFTDLVVSSLYNLVLLICNWVLLLEDYMRNCPYPWDGFFVKLLKKWFLFFLFLYFGEDMNSHSKCIVCVLTNWATSGDKKLFRLTCD